MCGLLFDLCLCSKSSGWLIVYTWMEQLKEHNERWRQMTGSKIEVWIINRIRSAHNTQVKTHGLARRQRVRGTAAQKGAQTTNTQQKKAYAQFLSCWVMEKSCYYTQKWVVLLVLHLNLSLIWQGTRVQIPYIMCVPPSPTHSLEIHVKVHKWLLTCLWSMYRLLHEPYTLSIGVFELEDG